MQRGFTLIELMVTLTILAVLATVALPLSQVAATRNRESELRQALWQIRSAIDAYKQAATDKRVATSLDDTGYPPELAVLVDGVKDATDPTGKKIYFLRRIPRDPFCDCPSMSNAQTWGIRSYASPPDSPQEGRDVYDVYTRSNAVGLNGTPYREW
ncbi:type II secretion system pseudopilin PulG [Jeongeupia sp. HS-3]|uniref:type II secretion system protein n=1 Tax=Jeongeupia sp. HS-3 TaxID=1009682 RepID=UPI0018A39E89|nr:type II secretion system protein [Jeongeupia sp. HS-3]BCL76049.1 type II secretion system pseudopilin PulG [Jeongeupia sp. HS-3]